MHNTSNIKKHTTKPLKKCKIEYLYIIKHIYLRQNIEINYT